LNCPYSKEGTERRYLKARRTRREGGEEGRRKEKEKNKKRKN